MIATTKDKGSDTKGHWRTRCCGGVVERGYQATGRASNPGVRIVSGAWIQPSQSCCQHQRTLIWAEDKQQIKVPESGGRVEKLRVQAAGAPVSGLHSVGGGLEPLCFIRSKVRATSLS